MMKNFQRVVVPYVNDAFKHFYEKGYLNLYSQLFGASQFPVFAIVSMIWSSYILHKSYLNRKKSIGIHLSKLLIAFLMVFLPRELAAIVMKQDSNIVNKLIQIPIFLVIYVLINYTPRNIFAKIVSWFAFILGAIQGINYIRFFGLLWRKFPKVNAFVKFNIASNLALLDLEIEIFSRIFLKGEETEHSNIMIIVLSILSFGIFYICNSILGMSMYYPILMSTLLVSALHMAPAFLKHSKEEK